MKTLKLSGRFYEPEWHIFDMTSSQLLGRTGRLVKSQSLAASYDTEEDATAEIVHIVQHPELWPMLPKSVGLKVISAIEAKSLSSPVPSGDGT